jgi:N-acetylglucosamine kinase-like BadF-type ATPase
MNVAELDLRPGGPRRGETSAAQSRERWLKLRTRENVPSLWGVDAGGSRTTAVVLRADGSILRQHAESISIGTVGADAAGDVLSALLDCVRSWLPGDQLAYGCVGSSSTPVAMEAPYPKVLVKAIESRAPAGTVLLTNDMVPMLYAPPVSGVGVVVSSGTGSSVLGRDASGQLVKIGGHEHIVSDEGSAYSLGRAALRAAAHAIDGTGPPTILAELAVGHFGMTVPALGRWLAENRSMRATVAAFAPVVLDASADPVAGQIIESNAAALALGVTVALDRLNFGAEPCLGFSGGVMRGSDFYRRKVEFHIRAKGFRPVVHVLDGANAVLSLAKRLREQGESGTSQGPMPGSDEGLYLPTVAVPLTP